MASDISFDDRLAPGVGPPDLSFSCVSDSPLPVGWEAAEPTYSCPYRGDNGENILHVYRNGACDVLQFSQTADYYVRRNCITCHPLDPQKLYLLKILLLGIVICYWLERQSILALHASAVVVNGRTAIFLGSSGGGKSTLAATFMHAGFSLVTDDALAVQRFEDGILCRPGYPNMRLWPDQCNHFLGYYRELEQVHPAYSKRRVPVGSHGFGAVCNTPQPLGCIYIPSMRHSTDKRTSIEITPITSREAVIELIRYSYLAHLVEALGLHAQRLDLLIQVAAKIPTRRISYPCGWGHLSAVREAILQDLESGV